MSKRRNLRPPPKVLAFDHAENPQPPFFSSRLKIPPWGASLPLRPAFARLAWLGGIPSFWGLFCKAAQPLFLTVASEGEARFKTSRKASRGKTQNGSCLSSLRIAQGILPVLASFWACFNASLGFGFLPAFASPFRGKGSTRSGS